MLQCHLLAALLRASVSRPHHLFPGKLTLKIPWKNLYNDAVVATLDGLYLLLVPGASESQLDKCSRSNTPV